ncbi:MAG TPA: alpha/beta hydrolase [Acidimicrobiales bacterium]|nr:alpha/beta hydrolase [Acidimicrobiales bacterium]
MAGKDRWNIVTRFVALVMSAPEWLIRAVAGPDPIVIDGRVLNRRVQFALAIGDKFGRYPVKMSDPVKARQDFRRLAPLGMASRTGVQVTGRMVPGPEGDIAVRIYRGTGSASVPPAIVYMHGGGWVVGDLDTHDASCRLLADESECVVVAVDYRLAPEHPFPAAVEDSACVYRWTIENADELTIDAARVAVMGDSAGGNLAAALTHGAAQLGIPLPAAQCLVYPALDATFSSPSCESMGHGYWLSLDEMRWFRSQYLISEQDRTSTLASPGLVSDFAGTPPTLVFAAGFDPLRDEAAAYAEALAKAGVPVRYRCYDDQIHGYFGMGVFPEAKAIQIEVCRAAGHLAHTGAVGLP